MRQREEIPSLGGMPQPPAKRIGAAEKARQMLEGAVAPMQAAQPEASADILSPEEGLAWKKLTTRIPAEQLEWLKGEARRYRTRNPKAPKVTIEEFITIAIDHLREAKNLDAVIAKHRS